MSMDDLVARLRADERCEVHPPKGVPKTPLALPEDVRAFYKLAGGAWLFRDADYGIEIVTPGRFVQANAALRGDEGRGDISFDWYLIAQNGGQCVSIDLAPARLGKCYDSFWETHALLGCSPVVATSFTDLLERLLAAEGRELFWKSGSFTSLGDAYDS